MKEYFITGYVQDGFGLDSVTLNNGQVLYKVVGVPRVKAEFKDNLCILTVADNLAGIIYTTDDTMPSLRNGTLYNKPFELKKNNIIRAIAVREGHLNSAVNTFYYDLEK